MAQPMAALDLAALHAKVDITDKASAFLDAGGERAPEAISHDMPKIGQNAKDLMQGGYHNGFYWVQFILRNSANERKSAQVFVNNRVLKHFEYFVFSLSPGPFEASRLQARLPVLGLTLAPQQEVSILLKMQFSLQDELSLQLEPVDPGAEKKADDALAAVLVLFGVIAGLLVFNIGLYILTRDAVFLLHALAASCLFADIFLLNGLSFPLFGIDKWNYLAPAFGNFAVATAIIFAQAYLNIKASYPVLSRLLHITTAIGLIGGTLLLCGFSKQVLYLGFCPFSGKILTGKSLCVEMVSEEAQPLPL